MQGSIFAVGTNMTSARNNSGNSTAAYTEGVQLVHLTPVLGTARLLCMSMVVSDTNIPVANLLTKFGKIPTDSEKI